MARIAAVVHDHFVPIYNVETDRETPFLVMKYIAGDSLQVRIDKEVPLEVAEILRIAIQVAAGLAQICQKPVESLLSGQAPSGGQSFFQDPSSISIGRDGSCKNFPAHSVYS